MPFALDKLRNAKQPEQRAHACAEAVTATRRSIKRLQRDRAPEEALSEMAAVFDQLLAELIRQSDASSELAIVALGGYGRGSVYPFSDIDLLILPDLAPASAVEQFVGDVIYPLWDAKLSVGHAVRTVDEMIALADEDLTARTSLLDARLLGGRRDAFDQLQRLAQKTFFAADRVNLFVEALIKERQTRHERFGETVYLLEPNIKSGKGGLRDLNTALWAADARFSISRLTDLSGVGAATPRQQDAFFEAARELARIRVAMHLHVGRAQDRLLFELQEELAPTLYPEPSIPGAANRGRSAVAPAVERMMHAYYRAARTVILESEGVLQRCHDLKGEPRVSLGGTFFYEGGRLGCANPEKLWNEPRRLVEVFELAHAHGLRLSRTLQDAIAEAVAGQPGAQLIADVGAAEAWRRLLVCAEPASSHTMLERLHDAGVLNAVIPEFEPCTGRVQHDLYHVYTVDQHSLYVLALLKSFRRGIADEQLPANPDGNVPTYTTPIEVMREIDDPETLYLAGLLHDVAKPLGAEHAERGARLVSGIVARLGLEPKKRDQVVFLVAEHLTMSHISQRRDLGDPSVVDAFADLVGTSDNLRRLYLLSIADAAMTAPGNLTDWKLSLLTELYRLSLRRLTGGAAANGQSEIALRRSQLAEELKRGWGDEAQKVADRVPDDFITGQQSLDALVHHVATVLEWQANSGNSVAATNHATLASRRVDATTTVVTICCKDRPGLLATIAGTMLKLRVEVLGANVFTLDPAQDVDCSPAVALDLFWVRTPHKSPVRRWAELSTALEAALNGDLDLDDLLTGRPSQLPARVVPEVATQVRIDNDASLRCSIVEVQAPALAGMLFAVTRELSRLRLQIDLSKLSTEAGRNIHIFYVREPDGQKITAASRTAEIVTRLEQAIEQLDG